MGQKRRNHVFEILADPLRSEEINLIEVPLEDSAEIGRLNAARTSLRKVTGAQKERAL